VYVGTISGGPPKLLTRRLDQPNAPNWLAPRRQEPVLLRDGQWVAFGMAERSTKSRSTAVACPLGEFGVMTGGNWGDEATSSSGRAGARMVCCSCPQTGGAGTPILELAKWRVVPYHVRRFCRVESDSPRGSRRPGQDNSPLTSSRSPIAPARHSHAESGRLVTCRVPSRVHEESDDVCRAVRPRADGNTRTAVAVLDDVAYDPIAGSAQYDVSRTGTLVYRRRVGDSMATVQWLDTTGKEKPLLSGPARMLERPECRPTASASRSPFRMEGIRMSGFTSPIVMR
jgi:hypothetical protein